jgi:hypothetical protein
MSARFDSSRRTLQFGLRGLQLCCTVVVLALYSYLLASLAGSGLDTPKSVRAVEGIAGVATLWIVCSTLMLRCIVGVPLTSFLSMFLDFASIVSFIYVAAANRGGAGSCQGTVNTPYGTGDADSYPKNAKGVPKFGSACKILTACMTVSIIVIFLFVFSILVEVQLARLRHREKRFGPDGLPPSKVEGGISNFSPMKWFHMHTGNTDGDYIQATQQTATASGALQIGTVRNFGDEEDPGELQSSPPQQAQTEAPLLAAPSQTSLPPAVQTLPPQPRLTYYDHGYQQPPSLPPLPPMRANTFESLYDQQPMRRTDTYQSQQPLGPPRRTGTYQDPSAYGPPRRAETFQPQGMTRTGTAPMDSFQRMDTMPIRAYSPPRLQRSNTIQSVSQPDLYSHLQQHDPMLRPMQRTATDIAYMQPGNRSQSPYQQPLSRTNSFPHNMQQGAHVRSQSNSPPRFITPPPPANMPYPDTRFLRPDLHPPRPAVPYPDNHPESVPYPGDHPANGQRQDGPFPNYQYDDSLYNQPR